MGIKTWEQRLAEQFGAGALVGGPAEAMAMCQEIVELRAEVERGGKRDEANRKHLAAALNLQPLGTGRQWDWGDLFNAAALKTQKAQDELREWLSQDEDRRDGMAAALKLQPLAPGRHWEWPDLCREAQRLTSRDWWRAVEEARRSHEKADSVARGMVGRALGLDGAPAGGHPWDRMIERITQLREARAHGNFVFMSSSREYTDLTDPDARRRATAADPVNSPEHYKQGGIECIDAIRAALTPDEFRGYCKGNTIKYVWRERGKGGDESLAKGAWYLDRLTGGAK